ncbi:MAG TPA: lasso peptide biosynthesis B2 protein [Candidatus Acidoferrum sp.]|nr:lasso peptide biosynthesis B2 protein [Candidatus Acidoferrum sp.]
MVVYLQAFWQLIRFEYYVLRRDFPPLHERVRRYPCASSRADNNLPSRLCSAVDAVCFCYPKQVLCLQRSAATVCLLRRYGVAAQMITGIQHFPLRAHAWVEVDGHVVNDKPYTLEIYTRLDSC